MESFNTGEQLDLEDLNQVWRLLEQRYNSVMSATRRDPPNHLTAKKFDESQPAGHRVYMSADQSLSIAMENQAALLTLLGQGAATPTVPWNMLRPTFESAFSAAWVMDPQDGRQRRMRGLRSEVRSHIERNAYLREFENVPEVSDTVRGMIRERVQGPESIYREEARQLHMTWDKAKEKISVTHELPTLSFLRNEDPVTRATFVGQWRLMSGYQHGLSWAMLAGSDTTVHAEIPGGREMVVTINDQAFVTAARVTVWLMLHALARRQQLHTSTV